VEYSGGLRDTVLERDEYRCRICGASGRGKGPITGHHRVPGSQFFTSDFAMRWVTCEGSPDLRRAFGNAAVAPCTVA
jgi:5-methylcytosine-specific restriction endonuclease McrA